ncbi:MAG: efflux RND transporter periplasmic adaptor subunit [Chloroflexi bacterium]|nr:efflux RND transporter periplasmic adaptor subunit [Chloroflexota bacterium]MCL5275404.1 efflux RND transporter periplasmic adaptor subunit [Chloroflexota bacterium]
MNQKKLPIIAAGLLVTTALVAACAAPGSTNTQRTGNGQGTGQRVKVTSGTISNHIIGTGTVVARSTAQLAFSHSGTVKTVNVKVGDQVKAGQVLATIDTSDLELTARQQYANYINAQASYSQTIAGPTPENLQAAQAAVISAQAAYTTALQGSTSAALGSAYAQVKSAQAALDQLSVAPSRYDVASAQANMLNAKAALDSAQAAYDSAFKRNPAGIGGTSAGLNLEQATNNYNAAKAAYDKLFEPATASAVSSAKAQVASAQANLVNLEPTQQKVASALQTLEQAKASLANLTPTDTAILQAKSKMDQAYLAWQQAEKAVTDSTLTAPFDGMVATVNIDVGDSAATGAAIEVADFTVPQFEVSVDESDLGNVKVGENAIVQLQTYPNLQIPGKVERVDAAGKTTGNIVTFQVYVSISNTKQTDGASPTILLGMSGTSQIETQRADNATLVPDNALIVDTQTQTYSVQRLNADGSMSTVPITIGFRGTNEVQALSGVKPGDTLLIPSAGAASTGGTGFGPGGGRPGGD